MLTHTDSYSKYAILKTPSGAATPGIGAFRRALRGACGTLVRFSLGHEEPAFPAVDHFAKLKTLGRVTALRFALEFSAVAIKFWLRWGRSTIEGGPFEHLLCFIHDQVPAVPAGRRFEMSFLEASRCNGSLQLLPHIFE